MEVSRPPGQGIALDAMGKIHVGLGRDARAYADSGQTDAMKLAQLVFQVPLIFPIIPITSNAGSAYLDGPQAGDYWSVRRLTLTGFTAGTVIAYRNGILTNTSGTGTLIGTPEQIAPFPQAGTFTFGRGEVLMNPNDYFALVATGVTLTAGVAGILAQGTADRVPAYLLPEYLN